MLHRTERTLENMPVGPLGFIPVDGCQELGKKVDEHLLEMYGLDKNEYTFIVPLKENFFSDGHQKVEIMDTVRGKDVFCLTDIGNCSVTYNMRGFINHMSPNDWIMELKDGIGACNYHTRNINIITPLLYAQSIGSHA